MTWPQYLFSFKGRVNRLRYWQGNFVALGFLAVAAAVAMPYTLIEHRDASATTPISALGIATFIAEGFIIFAAVVFVFALFVKRLHDRNRSAWWMLIFIVIPQALDIAADPRTHVFSAVSDQAAAISAIVALILSLWGFVEIGCLRGTVGENRYGPDPLAGRD